MALDIECWQHRRRQWRQFQEEDTDDESESSTKKSKTTGFVLEYDAARKIARGLGTHLENLGSLVEVSGATARLLPVGKRTRYLFGKDEGHATPAKKKKASQLDMFMKPLEGDRFYQAQRQWAFRRVDPRSFLAFHPPPDALQAELDIQNTGGAAWAHFIEIDGILTQNLVPELVSKSLEVECVRRGLQFCEDSHLLYFPAGLLPSNRLYFNKPDGRRPFVSVVGRRTYRQPLQRLPYRYQLAPVFFVKHLPASGFAAFVRVRLRLTDDKGTLLKGRTAVSRRKHLCRDWWNEKWFHRTLAMMQFLSDEGTVVIGSPLPQKIILNLAPDQWKVPIRVEEAFMNYNACRLGDNEPVTVKFSDAVGKILIANPKVTDRRPNFKYYI